MKKLVISVINKIKMNPLPYAIISLYAAVGLLIAFAAFFIYISIVPSFRGMQIDFWRNRVHLSRVANYFLDLEQEWFIASNIDEFSRGVLFVGGGDDDIRVTDARVRASMRRLYMRGYSIMGKSEGFVDFQRGFWLRDVSWGVAYSRSGLAPGEEVFFDLLEARPLAPLMGRGWYFYHTDFSQFRSRQ